MKKILFVLGGLAFAVGLFWIGQGSGVIQWPASSSMINQSEWIRNGALLAAAGLITILLGRRR